MEGIIFLTIILKLQPFELFFHDTLELALNLDALDTTHAISANVSNPAEIGLFFHNQS